jgi:hypothetical protein
MPGPLETTLISLSSGLTLTGGRGWRIAATAGSRTRTASSYTACNRYPRQSFLRSSCEQNSRAIRREIGERLAQPLAHEISPIWSGCSLRSRTWNLTLLPSRLLCRTSFRQPRDCGAQTRGAHGRHRAPPGRPHDQSRRAPNRNGPDTTQNAGAAGVSLTRAPRN